MESPSAPPQPVLRFLATARAARAFGLGGDELESLALRYGPGRGTLEQFTDAVTAALLDARSAASGSA
jgi:hypothetical protein